MGMLVLPPGRRRPASGEIVGSYNIQSPLPIATAAALTFIGFGLVVSPTVAALGIIALLALGALFIVQSAWPREFPVPQEVVELCA
jgi:hypothetical protein